MIGNAYELHKARQQELQELARQSGLVREAKTGQPTVMDSMMAWTGRRLVSAGEFLQAQSSSGQTPRGSLI